MTPGGSGPERPAPVLLSLGSNLGDRLEHLRRGVEGLTRGVEVEAVSSIYESAPAGYEEQPDFLNAVVRGRTVLGPRELLALAQEVEEDEGRRRSFPNAPRTLDIDILFFGDRVMREPGLTLPHPRWRERDFVRVPLAEVAGDWKDPESGRILAAAGRAAAPRHGLRRVAPGSRLVPEGGRTGV